MTWAAWALVAAFSLLAANQVRLLWRDAQRPHNEPAAVRVAPRPRVTFRITGTPRQERRRRWRESWRHFA